MIPLVSVIIPSFGRPKSLEAAINSILNQTYKNIEIIIVDDNPPESSNRKETSYILDNFLNHQNIIYILHEKNFGGAIARNTGFHSSHGSLITFLDDDDIYHPTKVEEQVNHILNEDLDVSLCSSNIVLHDGISGKFDCHPHGLNLEEFLLFGAAVTPMIMLRRTLFKKIDGFENTPRFQDHVLMIKIHETRAKIGILPLKLYTQNIHAGPRVSYSKNSKIGYEIKHKFENRNLRTLPLKAANIVKFRQEVELLPFIKSEFGLLKATSTIITLLPSVRSLKQALTLIKSFIKTVIR